MRSSIVCGLVVGRVLAGAALAAAQRPVDPGGKIGAMTVVRGNTYDADELVWVAGCNDLISKPGKYHWSCVRARVSVSRRGITPPQSSPAMQMIRQPAVPDARPGSGPG